MIKSRDAFRTISEVAEWLETPAHVLRFWESKFTQVKPVKRAGGRRYYRPADMELLGGIKTLLHHEGMTIKGVQKILREEGVKHVAGLSAEAVDREDEDDAEEELIAEAPFADVPEPDDIVVPFTQPPTGTDADEPVQAASEVEIPTEPDAVSEQPEAAALDLPHDDSDPGQAVAEEAEPLLDFESEESAPEPVVAEGFAADPDHSPLPDFLQHPMADDSAESPEAPQSDDAVQPMAEAGAEAQESVARTPRNIPADPDLDAIEVKPYCLSHLSTLTKVTASQAAAMAPVAARLRALVALTETGRKS